MRLCEHGEFEQAILRAAEHWKNRGLRPAIIEKDYYVTEALRELALAAGEHLIFKGGTSLSKGWGLIDRFSEDIDLFLDPQSFDPPLGAKRVDGRLRELRDTVTRVPGLVHDSGASRSFKGEGRSDHFDYRQRFAAVGEVRPHVLLEAGIASGREPVAERDLTSYLARFLAETGVSLGAADEQPFRMKLLHFRRTFVEKLFAIHGKVERLKRFGVPLGPYARHYYDLHRLAGEAEVRTMLASSEYREIQQDYEAVSLAHFPRDYACPDNKDFSKSDALFPPADLSKRLGAEYSEQCRQLCYGSYPAWKEVLARFGELRELLRGQR
jgi:hypothetical protein